MAKNNLMRKWLVVIIVIAAVLLIWKYYKLPDQEEAVTEQIEELEWEEIDEIVFLSREDMQIIREGNTYRLLTNDSNMAIDNQKVSQLFQSLNQLPEGELAEISFRQWEDANAEDALMLRLFHNTEEVLNLYLLRDGDYSYFRYLNDSIIYQSRALPEEQLQWLDSLTGN